MSEIRAKLLAKVNDIYCSGYGCCFSEDAHYEAEVDEIIKIFEQEKGATK